MDNAVFVLFLLIVQGDVMQSKYDITVQDVQVTPSSPSVYYFIRESKDFYGAQAYCTSEHTSPAEIKHQDNVTALMNTPKWPYTEKAWIGSFRWIASDQWALMNEKPAPYLKWSSGQPDDNLGNELCVSMTSDGDWHDDKCSRQLASLCYNGSDYILDEDGMTWSDSKTNCERLNSTLVEILDKQTNYNIQKLLPRGTTVWIGLKKRLRWYWATSSETATFTNWKTGQPDIPTERTVCAAMDLKDGTWTDEPCDSTYPFFCQGTYKARKTVVKLKIQSTANLDDPVISDNLQKELYAALHKQGVSVFQLTWKKPPVKEKEEETASEDNC